MASKTLVSFQSLFSEFKIYMRIESGHRVFSNNQNGLSNPKVKLLKSEKLSEPSSICVRDLVSAQKTNIFF